MLALAREASTGILIGPAIGWGFAGPRRKIDDVTLEGGISLLVPYLTYEVAERLGASAVLAVVTLGFLLQWGATEIATPAARLTGTDDEPSLPSLGDPTP